LQPDQVPVRISGSFQAHNTFLIIFIRDFCTLVSKIITLRMISYGKFRRHLERNVEYSNSFSVNEYKATV
jgi:hypothetical protein